MDHRKSISPMKPYDMSTQASLVLSPTPLRPQSGQPDRVHLKRQNFAPLISSPEKLSPIRAENFLRE